MAMTVSGLLLIVLLGLVSSLVPREDFSDRPQQLMAFVPFLTSADPLVTPAAPFIAQAEPSPSPLSSGADKPVVTVTLFGSLPCVSCQRIEDAMLTMMKRRPEAIRFGWKDFPLSVGGSASLLAARAGRCAAEQRAFGPYHRALLKEERMDIARLTTVAQKLGMDGKTLKQCAESSTHDASIQADIEEAERLGLSGTPTVFVGSTKLSPPVDLTLLAATIDNVLEQKKK